MPGRIIAIGDIHGCSRELAALIEAIQPTADDTIIPLGDVIDCGPDSRGVIEQLMALAKRCRLIPILGNHEEMLFNAFRGGSDLAFWLDFGGQQTLDSYGLDLRPEDIPAEHIEFLRSFVPYYETDTHIFVHANYDPWRDMRQQSWTTMLWEPLEPAKARPHYSGKTVIVGHTAQANGAILNLGFVKVIDTDCFRNGWLTSVDAIGGQLWRERLDD
jgi:serine/threonine protein phosphatase 1